jgi:hypothetical protein
VAGGLATLITEGWLNASFEGERHQRRVDMITRIEQRNLLLGVENHQSSPAEPSPELPAEPTDEPPAVSADEAPDLT